ncbi:hypothetical protein [Caballeronia sp. J97]|uniref:hypothetical protein n=1 Tax=Caballeronia sp. J97 TaxID=2805429 RepID=UPI002AAF7CDF|nr:hypothetical protein [Caballeronia sp. J97]
MFQPRILFRGDEFLITIKLLYIKARNIDINAMLQKAWIRDITLIPEPGLIAFDLDPDIGLDAVLICKAIIADSIRPRYR